MSGWNSERREYTPEIKGNGKSKANTYANIVADFLCSFSIKDEIKNTFVQRTSEKKILINGDPEN